MRRKRVIFLLEMETVFDETPGTTIRFDARYVYKYVKKPFVNIWYRNKPLEVTLLQKLFNCERIVQIVKDFETPDSWCIVMKRIPNSKDLYTFVTEKKGIEEDLAKKFVKQIIEAVLSCYKRGVCHRDLKDENVLVDMNTLDVFLLDFGSGQFYNEKRQYKDFYGSHEPPEYKQFKKYTDEPMSVWCLGIMVYQMITNLPVFNLEKPITRFPKKMSPLCIHFIQKCLTMNPKHRPKLQELLSHLWLTL
jgi:serine/threonine protein kinase